MNSKSKKIKKDQKQPKIDSYLVEKSIGEIISKRLNEEIEKCGKAEQEIAAQPNESGAPEIAENVNSDNIAQIELMKKKIDSLENKCKELAVKNTRLMNDNSALKKLLDASKSVNMSKDIQLLRLKSANTNVSDSSSIGANRLEPKRTTVFSNFAAHFTPEELIELNSVGKGKPQDANFIATCLKFLYKSDIKKLSTKCAGARNLKGKTTITPEKKTLMADLLAARVQSEGVDETLVVTRCGRLNRIIGDGIHTNIKRKTITSTPTTSGLENACIPGAAVSHTTSSHFTTPAQIPTFILPFNYF